MSASPYAATTVVSPEKTRVDIERLLVKYGATKFVSGWESSGAAVLFEMRGRSIRFSLPLPTKDDKRFQRSPKRAQRSPADVTRAHEQHVRSAWRALFLVIKAKLEAVEAGIGVFESEFLAHIVIPGTGQTFGEWAIPQIADAYDKGLSMPLLLGPASALSPDAHAHASTPRQE